MTSEEILYWQSIGSDILIKMGIAITPEEIKNMEVADLALGEFRQTGLFLLTYINNNRYCAKELVLLPGQTCPEHKHPSIGDQPGKQETFRCRSGIIYLYVEGTPVDQIKSVIPKGSEPYYTVFHEIELHPGEQYTIEENTFHWFQAGHESAVVSEFSSTSRDECDVFTDPRIQRVAI